MKQFALAVLAGGIFGALSCIALLPHVVDTTRDIQVGDPPITLPIPRQYLPELYSRGQVYIAAGLAAAFGAIIAVGIAWGVTRAGTGKRRKS